ncbi:MAG TPA: ABC transporter ATP-binding protein [Haliscomenobacter sp.]|uniref:ABC transporter ATP-binding protein n=1 Tax=Haliscomenobacter sp. TaxID=2717303 RepID=UPI002C79BE02|nr:ABC transporter ATP-binding protein [Haliscomenobacter sp.]HOY18095.1 ABC transporter ATP-binding protein [Haliscomenobacter sp.]HPH19259.1 ABC transporter ATP-binding protein [Haliscomenobacter sp.]
MSTTPKKVKLADQFSALKNLPSFFTLIWQTEPRLAAINIVLRLLKAGVPLLTLYLGKLIVDEIIRLMSASEKDLSQLWLLLGAEFAVVIVSDLLNRGIGLTENLLGDLVSNRTSVDIMQHAAKLDLFQFENPEFYDKLERARRQTTNRTVLMTQVLTQFQDIITIFFLGAGLVAFNPWLILILFVAVIPSFLGESYFNQQSYSLSLSWTPERRELDYLRYIGASDETAKEVKIFNLSNFIIERFKKLSHKYFLANRKIIIQRSIWGLLLAALGSAAYYGAYVLIALQTVGGLITVGTLTFLTGSFQRLHGLLEGVMTRFSKIAESALYLKDLFDFFNIKPDIVSTPGSRPFPEKLQGGFVFENVSFRYPDQERWAIRNLSFTLEAGEKLALVGENGAGKTTLVKLLARLYEPTEGRILIDGVDIRDYNLQSLRQSIGIIFQDYIRFQLTAAENIAVGDIAQKDKHEDVVSSAEKSLANTVIDQLPERYEQMLGRRFKNGVDLSGGQWQKIALGRAYMRDAQLLILDEPTSALDARAEHEVFLRFAELISGKSAVLISHRFSTVRMADRILVLENGQMVEIGSHEELLAKGGKYAELFTLQAQGYV